MALVRMSSILLALCAGVLVTVAKAHAQTHEITDILGRQVTVPTRIEGMILGESRFIPALAIVDEQAGIPRIKGMLADLQQYDPITWQLYADQFPKLEKIPLIGQGSAESFSIEKAISLRPDVAIFGISGHGPSPENAQMRSQLEAAGIPVVFVDFREAPLENTVKSVRTLGKLLGGAERAEAFNDTYQERLNDIRRRVAEIPDEKRPTVFLHSKVGLFSECCETMGDTMLGALLSAAGGNHIGADLIRGHVGNVNIEYLLEHPPEKYLATAIGSSKLQSGASHYVQLGADIEPDRARQSLRDATDDMLVRHLDAVQQGETFAVWHHFYNSPFHIAALAAMAQWLHPDVFVEQDAEAFLADLFERFQPTSLQGTYWISGGEGQGE